VDTRYGVPSGFEANRDEPTGCTRVERTYPHQNVVLKLEYRNYDLREGARSDELGLGIGFAF
jgi:hypothetical protein